MAEMHFLHLRLAKNSFQWWENTDDLKAAQEEVTKLLKEEGWHHTPSLSINPRAHSMGGAAAILAPANESRFKVSVPIVARAVLWLESLRARPFIQFSVTPLTDINLAYEIAE